MRKHLPLTLAALVAGGLLFPTAAFAQSGGEVVNGGFGIGLGYASVEDGDGEFLALVQYRGEAWEVEFDYLFGDDSAWALHGNYLFNFDRDYTNYDTGFYAGVGYTYLNFDSGGGTTGEESGSDSQSGINVLLGYDIDADWSIEGRYAFVDNDFFTITATWNFGEGSDS